MKQLLLICTLFCLVITANAQKAYIQVNGEPGLSVYLNNQFKGKTTVELKGYIIENVTPGNNLIKIEKEGYAPYEETVSVKGGEVFSYKVKPFVKHTVRISQEGHTGETDKKVAFKTGKLVVQSVPIEISISIPQIDGVNNIAKNKDQWIAEDIPVGSYTITFKFNNKTVTKTIEIAEDNVTSAFVNMLSGEFTAKNTLSEKKAAELSRKNQVQYVQALCDKYHIKAGLTLNEFVDQCPGAKILLSYPSKLGNRDYIIPDNILQKKSELTPGYTYLTTGAKDYNIGKVVFVRYTLAYTKDLATARAVFDRYDEEFRTNIEADKRNGKKERETYMWSNIFSAINGIHIDVTLRETSTPGWYETVLTFNSSART